MNLHGFVLKFVKVTLDSSFSAADPGSYVSVMVQEAAEGQEENMPTDLRTK